MLTTDVGLLYKRVVQALTYFSEFEWKKLATRGDRLAGAGVERGGCWDGRLRIQETGRQTHEVCDLVMCTIVNSFGHSRTNTCSLLAVYSVQVGQPAKVSIDNALCS